MTISRGASAPATAVTAVTKPPRRRRTPSAAQQQKNEETRRRLLEAAGRVVGRHGYAGASIARITEKAGVAHGAFYLHFKSQQDLFDILLPVIGADMLDAISEAIQAAGSLDELERRGFHAMIDYLVAHPHLWRVTTEAELYAPKAYALHLQAMTQRYVRSLKRSLAHDEVRDFAESELEAVAAMLMGARHYLITRHAMAGGKLRPVDDSLAETYVKLVLHGLKPRR